MDQEDHLANQGYLYFYYFFQLTFCINLNVIEHIFVLFKKQYILRTFYSRMSLKRFIILNFKQQDD